MKFECIIILLIGFIYASYIWQNISVENQYWARPKIEPKTKIR